MGNQSVKNHGEGCGALEAELRRDLLWGGFFTLYQPFYNLRTNKVQGYEAFVRRGTPHEDALPPAAFLPVAEASDLICDLDSWVLDEALTQLSQWHQLPDGHDLILSINLSSRHVTQPRVIDDITTALHRSGVLPDRLLVDVTEPTILTDRAGHNNLRTLQDQGVSVCLDHFGAAGEPDTIPLHLPIDIVKLDPRCLDITTTDSRAMLRRLVAESQDHGLPIVAGGIETPAQLDYVRHLGCEWAQGFHLGRPMTAATINTIASPHD